MHEQFKSKTVDDTIHHIIEECGECIKEYGKIQRFGKENYNPLLPIEQRETNIKAFERELKDLEILIVQYWSLAYPVKTEVQETKDKADNTVREGNEYYTLMVDEVTGNRMIETVRIDVIAKDSSDGKSVYWGSPSSDPYLKLAFDGPFFDSYSKAAGHFNI